MNYTEKAEKCSNMCNSWLVQALEIVHRLLWPLFINHRQGLPCIDPSHVTIMSRYYKWKLLRSKLSAGANRMIIATNYVTQRLPLNEVQRRNPLMRKHTIWWNAGGIAYWWSHTSKAIRAAQSCWATQFKIHCSALSANFITERECMS